MVRTQGGVEVDLEALKEDGKVPKGGGGWKGSQGGAHKEGVPKGGAGKDPKGGGGRVPEGGTHREGVDMVPKEGEFPGD